MIRKVFREMLDTTPIDVGPGVLYFAKKGQVMFVVRMGADNLRIDAANENGDQVYREVYTEEDFCGCIRDFYAMLGGEADV